MVFHSWFLENLGLILSFIGLIISFLILFLSVLSSLIILVKYYKRYISQKSNIKVSKRSSGVDASGSADFIDFNFDLNNKEENSGKIKNIDLEKVVFRNSKEETIEDHRKELNISIDSYNIYPIGETRPDFFSRLNGTVPDRGSAKIKIKIDTSSEFKSKIKNFKKAIFYFLFTIKDNNREYTQETYEELDFIENPNIEK